MIHYLHQQDITLELTFRFKLPDVSVDILFYPLLPFSPDLLLDLGSDPVNLTLVLSFASFATSCLALAWLLYSTGLVLNFLTEVLFFSCAYVIAVVSSNLDSCLCVLMKRTKWEANGLLQITLNEKVSHFTNTVQIFGSKA